MMNQLDESRSIVKFSSDLEEQFFKSLESKTSWGRNDLKDLFKSINKDMLIANLLITIEENTPMTCEEL